jgi:5-methylcytosine-specific restriction enzyme subunit McrC
VIPGTDHDYRRSDIHLQARSNRLWLLSDMDNRGKFRLNPDIVICTDKQPPHLILDTKWKRLLSDEVDTKNGVQQSDMYQLYAYATRYQCAQNILLFPRLHGVTPKRYKLFEDNHSLELRVDFLDLNYDLRLQKERLLNDFNRILNANHISNP